jgi:uncharacterized protein involved in outer membrane biogenesis
VAQEKKQKSTLAGALFTIAVLLVLLVIMSPFIIDSILKVSIEKAIRNQLHVGASVSRVHFNLTEGSIEVNDLQIENPQGYDSKNIIELKSISVKANLRTLVSDTVDVNHIRLNDLAVLIEQKGAANNMADILKSMPKKPAAAKEEKKEEITKSKEKNIHISEVEIQNIDVTAKLSLVADQKSTVQLKIPELRISNIGTDKKMTFEDVISRIFNEIANKIATEGGDVLPRDVTGAIEENIGEVSGKIEKIKEEVQDVTEKLKGLFKKKD